MSGCDTVSGICRIGKTKLIKLLEDSRFGEALEPFLQVFLLGDFTPEMLLVAGSTGFGNAIVMAILLRLLDILRSLHQAS